MFDALKYNRKLIAAGQPQELADIFSEAFNEMAESNVVTKLDLKDLQNELSEFKVVVRSEFKNVYKEFENVHKEFGRIHKEFGTVHNEFKNVRNEMRLMDEGIRKDLSHKIEKLKKDMIIHTGAMQAASVALIVGLLKLL